MKQKLIGALCTLMLLTACIVVLTGCGGATHRHAMEYHEAIEATCTENGNIEYWSCSECEKYFSDEEGHIEIAADDLIIVAHHTDMSYHQETQETCTTAGNSAYWYCSVCNKYFSDENGKTEITANSWIIPAIDHANMVFHEAVQETCTIAGNTPYWSCPDCGRYFSDEAGKTELAENSWIIPETGHAYSSKWSYGDTHHWHAAICGHEEVSEYAEHFFENGNCIICECLQPVTEGLAYTLINGNAEYEVSGIGSAAVKQILIPDTYLGLPVTSIGDRAFAYYSGLVSITIPDSVKNIGNSAFSGCYDLESVTIGNGVERIGENAFSYCNKLTGALIIPDNVTSIGNWAFFACSNLTSVTIGSSVTSIGNDSFRDCYKLIEVYNKTEIPITAGIGGYGEVAYHAKHVYTSEGGSWLIDTTDGYRFFYDGNKGYLVGYYGTETLLTLPQSFTAHNGAIVTEYEIHQYAFYDCNELKEIVFSESILGVGDYAFGSCNGLTEMVIPGCVIWIGAYAFAWCDGIERVTIENGVKILESYAFDNCNGITEIVIPVSVTNIGEDVFSCSGLDSITVTEGNTVYHSAGNCLIETASKTLILGCKNSVIPSDGSVTSIGDYAFCGCESLTEIVIPSSVTSIGLGAFLWCSALTEIVIPDSVTSIEYDAFADCTNLANVTIGNGMKSIRQEAFANTAYYNNSSNWENDVLYIGKCLIEARTALSGTYIIREGTYIIADYAFMQCSGLNEIIFSNSVEYIGDYAFLGCEGLTEIIFPDNLVIIGEYAFSECSSLTSVTFADDVKIIENNAFWRCDGLTGVYIGNLAAWSEINFASEPANPLYYAHNLYLNGEIVVDLVIPDTVTRIGDNAFTSCSGLMSVTIPDSVISIGGYAFARCVGLTELIIPDSVTTIGDKAFYVCPQLISVAIGNGVINIGNSAFSNCEILKYVIIGNNVKDIGESAFSRCNALSSVYYYGTAEEWGEISVAASNILLTSATIYYYSETEPALNTEGTAYNGNYWKYAEDGKTVMVWIKELA